jgi:hypothetical protein
MVQGAPHCHLTETMQPLQCRSVALVVCARRDADEMAVDIRAVFD